MRGNFRYPPLFASTSELEWLFSPRTSFGFTCRLSNSLLQEFLEFKYLCHRKIVLYVSVLSLYVERNHSILRSVLLPSTSFECFVCFNNCQCVSFVCYIYYSVCSLVCQALLLCTAELFRRIYSPRISAMMYSTSPRSNFMQPEALHLHALS